MRIEYSLDIKIRGPFPDVEFVGAFTPDLSLLYV